MNPFSLTKNFALILIVILLILVGFFAFNRCPPTNNDSISFDELTQSYIAKNDVKFSDLPPEVQAQYVEKEHVVLEKEEDIIEGVLVDEEGMPLLDENATQSDMQKALEKFQEIKASLEDDKTKMKQKIDALELQLEDQAAKQRDMEQFYKEIHQEILADKEEEIKALYKQIKQNESDAIKNNNEQIKVLKEKLAKAEQTHLSDEAKYKSLEETYKRKEQSYLDQIQEIKNLSKLQEKNLLLAKEEIEKKLLSTEETLKTLQAKTKSLENKTSKDKAH